MSVVDSPFLAQLQGIDQIGYRWIHVIAGVLWIGVLWFFNWINGAFTATLDGDTKRKVVPELMPRALFWFRWGAAFTWLTGVALLMKLYYAGLFAMADGTKAESSVWLQAFAGLFVGFIVYDLLFKTLGKQAHAVCVVIWGALAIGFGCYLDMLGFSQRAIYIHIGALFGTSMAANVWMRIWPAQKRIITAIKNGQAPAPADPALAGLRSKHNTYMSVPLLLLMVSVNQDDMLTWPYAWQFVATGVLAVGFGITWAIYNWGVPRVKGF
mgnify:CR=1 FL=1